MTESLNIALAQLNVTVGDISGNTAKIIETSYQAAKEEADLVVFPELAITGYPPEDLVFKGVFQHAAMDAVERITNETASLELAILVGGLWAEDGKLYNSVFLIEGGKVLYRQDKCSLPNYGVFDEKRLFAKGKPPQVMRWRGLNLGVLICEDVWDDRWPAHLAPQSVDMLLTVNASPYEVGKAALRHDVLSQAARVVNAPVVYLNLIGGQDELVFDGRSCIVNPQGDAVARLRSCQSELVTTQWHKTQSGWQCTHAPLAEWEEDMLTIYRVMVLGLQDYVEKNGFKGVVIGLSGGIDSGLTATVAVDALGAERVHGIMMPSPYTSGGSIEDATALAQRLGIQMDSIPIEKGMAVFDEMLKDVFAGREADTTEENIQARLRGNLLMAVSNKLGLMVLTTGNKSEMSVGYATLYGDMCGGYSVLKDVYKTTVFRLSHWRNEYQGNEYFKGPAGRVIPERMITKPPSAELKPNQKDEDSLPPYEVLDVILRGLIEERKSIKEVAALGYDEAEVERVARMMYLAEYKRRQAPPGVKVTGMSFGRDRRYPITNKWIWQRGS